MTATRARTAPRRPPEAAPGIDVADVRRLALPLRNEQDLAPLLARVGDARFVLLGEASHGSHEYYKWRAEITRKLVIEKGFSFVAVEGDWPDCYRINGWLKGEGGASAQEILGGFERWPTWMWANEEIADFIEWLRRHNAARRSGKVGFYGLDVYSLWDSLRAVLAYLEEHDEAAVQSALRAWWCFEPYGEDPQEYAWSTRLVPTSCEDEVVEMLTQLRSKAESTAHDAEARFDAEQNAAVAAEAERYYRAMVRGGPDSWNIRDTHMSETLERLTERHGDGAKAVVWAYNTHIGDARGAPPTWLAQA